MGVTDAPTLGDVYRQIPMTFGFCTSIHASKSGGYPYAFRSVECGKRIQSSRKVKNLTRVQLAEQLNISFDHMRLTERGKRACSIDLLVDLSLILEVSLDYLILGKESKADPMKDELNKAIEMLKKIKGEL